MSEYIESVIEEVEQLEAMRASGGILAAASIAAEYRLAAD